MVKIGVGLPARLDYKTVQKIVIESDKLGFDGIWSGDHLRQPLECWTLLTTLASQTKNIKLGSMCTCVSYRSPVLLAKIAATMDVASGGRANLGIGAGWIEEEYDAYGLDFPKPSIRIKQLREAVKIIKNFWTNKEVSFKGKYWQLKGVKPLPKPIQKPHPPLWICLYGHTLLKLTAELANGWNTGNCTLDQYKQKISFLKEYCSTIGRNYQEITNSIYLRVIIADSQKEVEKQLEKNKPEILRFKNAISKNYPKFGNMSLEEFLSIYIKGTPEDCVEQIHKYTKAGANYILLYFQDITDLDALRLFAEKVKPHI